MNEVMLTESFIDGYNFVVQVFYTIGERYQKEYLQKLHTMASSFATEDLNQFLKGEENCETFDYICSEQDLMLVISRLKRILSFHCDSNQINDYNISIEEAKTKGIEQALCVMEKTIKTTKESAIEEQMPVIELLEDIFSEVKEVAEVVS